ncbi:hypothetical protein L6R29_14225 [Myxococcota bacterium]|nr:hypothetical protein [Myxococcota bacterium]
MYVRTQNPRSSALEALLQKGAMPWPEPSAPEDMARLWQKQPTPSTTFPSASPSSPTQQPFLWQAPPTPPAIVEPKEALFHTVRVLITHQLSKSPMDDKELAATLDVSENQTKAWLERLIVEGCVVKKSSRPLRYALRSTTTEPTTQNA